MILFQDSEILVLNKPPGLPSVPLSQGDPSAVDLAQRACPELAQAFPDSLERGLLHRLDTGTSGCLAFAKNAAVFDALRNAWKTEAVQKTYRALTLPGPLPGPLPFKIDAPLVRHKQKRTRIFWAEKIPERFYRGEPLLAITWLEEASEGVYEGQEILDLRLRIETGVMHQIRVHLSGLGLPILGDTRYGEKKPSSPTRLFLHAWKLGLKFGARPPVVVEAPLPWAV